MTDPKEIAEALRDYADGETLYSSNLILEAADLIESLQLAQEGAIKALELAQDSMIAAVRKHHSQTRDDLCWMDDNEMYAAFGLPPKDTSINSPEEQLEMCKKFIKNRCTPGGTWKSYKELEEENVYLKKQLVEEHEASEEINHILYVKRSLMQEEIVSLKKEITELNERLDRVYDSIKE